MSGPSLIFCFLLAMGFSFLFSGMESGVFALNRLRIRHLKKHGKQSAQILHGFLEQPERFLWTILVGNTLANFFAASLLVFYLKDHFPSQPWLFWALFVVIVFFLLYGLCDLLPKMLFRLFPNRLCLWLAAPFRLINAILSPLTRLVSWLAKDLVSWSDGKIFTGNLFGNRDELRLFVQESSDNLSSDERTMISRVLDLQNRTVRQIAIPLDKAITISDQAPVRQVMDICLEKNITRLPVWTGEGSQKRIVGILSLRSALYREDFNPDLKAETYLRPALYLDEDMRLETALARLQRAGERIAIVLDHHRKEIGLVSLQDILKTVFGEVQL